MGLPIISEIFDGIRWIIDFFINKAPKPIKILLFLLFLLLLGNTLSWFFHLTGVHCNSAKEVVKVDAIDIPSNVKILWKLSRGSFDEENYSIQQVHPYNKFIGSGDIETCVWVLEDLNGSFEVCQNISNPDCNFYYRTPECFNCSTVDIGWLYDDSSFFNWWYVGDLCSSDVNQIEDWDFFKRWLDCEPLCSIPTNYQWNFEEGYYECVNLDYCGENATIDPDSELDEELDYAGARLLYQTTDEKNFETFMSFRCSDELHPRLTLFGQLDIFDYKFWLILILVGVMIYILLQIKRLG